MAHLLTLKFDNALFYHTSALSLQLSITNIIIVLTILLYHLFVIYQIINHIRYIGLGSCYHRQDK